VIELTPTPGVDPSTERHLGGRAAWLRAAVLGANDGLISTSSLVVAVAAAGSARGPILIAGIAALSAGALSMAAGEYVSVSSQRDVERGDLARERVELASEPESEHEELVRLQEAKGLSRSTAELVARELERGDLLRVHAREELGLDLDALARPVQAAVVSALSFTLGAIVPILVVVLASETAREPLVWASTLVGLTVLGGSAARIGGAPVWRAALRVLVAGVLALGASLLVGTLTGTVV
jgi:VIT1/CCC1 family predicted Fe2+/Mn2+ transporter